MDRVETSVSEAVDSASRETGGEAAAQTAPTGVRQQVSVLNKELDEAADKFERLQSALATQHHLEQLLRQGRAHLQDLRSRLEQMTAERDALQTKLGDDETAHRLEIDRHRKRIGEQNRQILAQRTLVEQHQREVTSKHEEQQEQIAALRQQFEMTLGERDRLAARLDEREHEMLSTEEEHRQHFGRVTAERDRLAAQLEAREAAQKQIAAEHAEERSAFERLLAEARSNERDLVQELDQQSQQNKILREAAIRAQALARKIMNAHEPVPAENGSGE